MAIFRPEVKQGNKFTGLCKCAIVGFEDKSGSFDWADMMIEVSVLQENQEWPRTFNVSGTLEKDASGKITGGNALNRIYAFFDVIGCKAGLNTDGSWEDEAGSTIDDIAEYLTARFAKDKETVDTFGYYAYFYKEQPKKIGAKPWVKVMPMLAPTNNEGEAKIMDSVKWRKSKGFLKEFDDTATPVESADLGLSALDNL